MPRRPLLRRVALAAAAALPLVLAAVAARQELAPDGIGVDDAHIFLHYGRSLAAGNGWTWNPGEPPVEGTSSPLWTLVAAAAVRVDPLPYDLLFVLSLILVAAALIAWLELSAPGRGGTETAPGAVEGALAFGLATGSFLAVRPDFPIWTGATLMDSAPWTAALLALAATHARLALVGTRRAALAAAGAQVALALTRSESLLLGPIALGATLLAAPGHARRLVGPLAAAAGAQVALALWRLGTFGWPLPNTYYAKVGDDPGARLAEGGAYLLAALGRDPWWIAAWLLAAITLAGAALRRDRSGESEAAARSRAARTVAAALLLGAPLIALFVGGDFFTGSRILVPFLPLAATLLLLAATGWLQSRLRPRPAIWGASLAVALLGAGTYAVDRPRYGDLERTTLHGQNFDAARGGFPVGEQLERLFADAERKPTVGLLAAGSLPLVYSGPTRDLLGLNDAAIAHATRRRSGVVGHSAFDAAPLFAAPPEILLVGTHECRGTPHERLLRRFAFRVMLADLDLDPRFPEVYALARLCAPPDCADPLCAYARRDWLASGAGGVVWGPAPESAPPPGLAAAP